jgi:hypothetical protein
MQTMQRKLAVKLERLAALPSLQRQAYFEREGKGGEERNLPWPPKIFAVAPSEITEPKLDDNPIVDWGFRYRSTRKPRLSCHRRTRLALMERFQT